MTRLFMTWMLCHAPRAPLYDDMRHLPMYLSHEIMVSYEYAIGMEIAHKMEETYPLKTHMTKTMRSVSSPVLVERGDLPGLLYVGLKECLLL